MRFSYKLQNNYLKLLLFFSWISILLTLYFDFEYLSSEDIKKIFELVLMIAFLMYMAYRKKVPGNCRIIISTSISIMASILIFTTILKLKKYNYIYNENQVELIFIVLLIALNIAVFFLIQCDHRRYLKQMSINSEFGDIDWISDQVNSSIENGCKSGILLLVDVKNFRIINSLYGRQYGNSLIKKASEFLHPYMNKNCLIAHLGGIEFCLWIKERERSVILSELEIKKRIFKSDISFQGKHVDLFIHTAGVEYPTHGNRFNDLYSKANLAMEKTQLNERKTVLFYTQSMGKDFSSENQLFLAIQKSLELNEFFICYQKKYNMDGTQLLGLEALARCQSSDAGLLPPHVFIPIIHKFNLSIPFTNYIIKSVFSDMEIIDRLYEKKINVSINIPSSYFLLPEFIDKIKMEITENSIDPGRLIFEITEDIFIDGYESANAIFKKLREIGIRISLDDFGTGYSSLSYIQNLQIQEIKIDRSFISRIAVDKKSFALVKAICDIAYANGYLVVAEGVEEYDQIEVLKRTTCNIVQGFIYSKPERLLI